MTLFAPILPTGHCAVLYTHLADKKVEVQTGQDLPKDTEVPETEPGSALCRAAILAESLRLSLTAPPCNSMLHPLVLSCLISSMLSKLQPEWAF